MESGERIGMKINDIIRRKLLEKSIQKTVGHRWHQKDKKEALSFLLQRAIEETSKTHDKKEVLLIGRDVNDVRSLQQLLSTRNIKSQFLSLSEFLQGTTNSLNFESISLIVACTLREKDNMQCAQAVSKITPIIPFEYAFIQNENYQIFNAYDQAYYNSSYFVSPLLSDEIDIFKIYKESLELFELKCDIRDYMDLYQNLKNIKTNNVVGDIVEFGSYKGHSGYLISQLLLHLKLEKKLYMYDTFVKFPTEKGALDSFWSKTHEVSFSDIKSKFKSNSNVKLVKGDFTKTFIKVHPNKIALAYVDCDSYRATNFILDKVFDNFLSKKGIMVFEDFGHPALLGNRVAIKKYFKNKKNVYSAYSQFSGLFSAVKIA